MNSLVQAPQDSLQVLLVEIGGRAFGLPLGDVRHVAALPSTFASHGPQAEAHFVFGGEPLPYKPLWDHLALASIYGEFEELQASLPQRRQDHIDWMGSLEDSLRNGTPFSKARNPRECAFGKWFYAYRSRERSLERLLGQFERPHAVIHSLADRLLDIAAQGNVAEALRQLEDARATTLSELLKLFDSAQRLVVELQRRIAVIVSDDRITCALGADRIRDVVEIPGEQIRQDRQSGAGRATSGLIILENQEVVPLLNWPMLAA